MLVGNHSTSTEPGQLKPLEGKTGVSEGKSQRGGNPQVLSAHISAETLDHKCANQTQGSSAKD